VREPGESGAHAPRHATTTAHMAAERSDNRVSETGGGRFGERKKGMRCGRKSERQGTGRHGGSAGRATIARPKAICH